MPEKSCCLAAKRPSRSSTNRNCGIRSAAYGAKSGRILLHSKEKTWLDDFSEDQEVYELEANQFAAETLIPGEQWGAFRGTERFTSNAVKQFANEVGIASSIVAGRLHREELVSRTQLLDLKISLADRIKS